jgi:hypothetical protein
MGPTDGTGIQQLRPTTYSRDAGSGTKNMQGEKILMVTKYSSAVENKIFWKTILMLKRNHAKPHQKLILWAEKMGIEDIGSLDIKHINSQLRQAQKQLRAVQTAAVQLRENHLRELLELTREHGDDKQHERRLQILIRAHKKQHSYKKIQAILKPKQ